MANQRFASGTNTTTSLNTIYTVSSGSAVVIFSFVLTNTTSNNVTVSAYVNDGTADILVKTVTIPAGSGKSVIVLEMLGSLSGGDIIKIQAASTDAFNYLVTGRLS